MEDPTLRKVELRSQGHAHGPITRLISPDELGNRLKPFIFLDFFNAEIQPGFGFPMHPHSGIATLTWQPGCDVQYQDTTGQSGVLKAGGLEWMNAGGGAWHQGKLLGSGRATGFQLWVPMPPGVEDGPSVGQYVPPEKVDVMRIPGGELRMLLESKVDSPGGARSAIDSHQDMNYFAVTLQPDTTWRYTPPAGHTVAWAFPYEGAPQVQGKRCDRELLVFDESAGSIEVTSQTEAARVLIGSASLHRHPLVLGPSSVHTTEAALRRGLDRIREIGGRLPHEAYSR